VLINSAGSLDELGLDQLAGRFRTERVVTLAASDVARELLGRPMPNAALLGGFAALTGKVSIDALGAAIHARFPGAVGDGNVAAARRAYELVGSGTEEPAHA
jgi:pyruvate ferredoxin oxidoreductase gamma subunit